jgi:hypothetical protein
MVCAHPCCPFWLSGYWGAQCLNPSNCGAANACNGTSPDLIAQPLSRGLFCLQAAEPARKGLLVVASATAMRVRKPANTSICDQVLLLMQAMLARSVALVTWNGKGAATSAAHLLVASFARTQGYSGTRPCVLSVYVSLKDSADVLGPVSGPCTQCTTGRFQNVTNSASCNLCAVSVSAHLPLILLSCSCPAGTSSAPGAAAATQCSCTAGKLGPNGKLIFIGNVKARRSCTQVARASIVRRTPGNVRASRMGLSLLLLFLRRSCCCLCQQPAALRRAPPAQREFALVWELPCIPFERVMCALAVSRRRLP